MPEYGACGASSLGRLKGVPECVERPPGGPENTTGGLRERSCLKYANRTGCLPRMTWDDAKGACEAHGARLCTLSELPAAKGTGCGFDDEYVWVWEACQHSMHNHTIQAQFVVAQGGNTRNYYCTAEPPPPPPVRPPPLQLLGGEAEEDASTEDVEAGLEVEGYVAPLERFRGQTFAGAIDGLLGTASPPVTYLDWEMVPVSFLSVACRFGRKLHDGSACTPLSPSYIEGASYKTDQPLAAYERPPEEPTFSGVSYSSWYLATKAAELPALPWYGYEAEAAPKGGWGKEASFGVWTASPSRLLSHAGYLLQFHGGHPSGGCDLLRFTYLRPADTLWRVGASPFDACCIRGELDRACLPTWLQAALGNGTHLHAPGVLYDPVGVLPDSTAHRTRHFVLYYSSADEAAAHAPLACIGRASGRWVEADELCAPRIEWEHDDHPVLCSNARASADVTLEGLGNETVADEALAYGAEPFYGMDGSLYLVYGAREPGHIRIVQLNESSARLPRAAQPGKVNASQAVLYHEVARGPSFALGRDVRAPPTAAPAYHSGKVQPLANTTSLVANAFVHPLVSRRNGSAEYYLFVEWYGGDEDHAANASLSRVYVGRSVGSPLGPYLDRIGNDMSKRTGVVLGDERTISIVSAVWGANCDGGTGYDVSAVARLRCEGQASCEWTLRYQELDAIDPLSYQHYDFPAATQTVADRHSDTPNHYADTPGCPRAVNITYRCTKHAVVLYDGEELGAEEHVFVPGEAANGSVASLSCETPAPVFVPGGSLFADPQRLGGDLHFATVGHAGVFTYERNGSTPIHVFTFQYHTKRSPIPELGARRIRFAADGWPILAEDYTAQWATCGVPEAAYASGVGDPHVAPASYHAREAHYDPATRHQEHYLSSSSTRTHCRHHAERGWHCVGNSLRATHPGIGVAGPEGDLLHGTINEVGTESYWREQEDQCNPLVETQLGRKLKCTRFVGKGDLNASGHITTMERIRGCPRLHCEKKWACRSDTRTRAVAGTVDTCTDGLECKKLVETRVVPWESSDFFAHSGAPIVVTRDGLVVSRVPPISTCHAKPVISRLDPQLGVVGGGTTVTVYGTGFGHPARCRFGWLEVPAENVTAHEMRCPAPPLNRTYVSRAKGMPVSIPLERLVGRILHLEVSMMPSEVLDGMPLTDPVREARGDNFTADRFRFQYHDPAKIAISFLRPRGGPTAGGTHIDVHGKGFWPSDANSNLRCRFTWHTEVWPAVLGHETPYVVIHTERVLTNASFANAQRVSCHSPARRDNRMAILDVTFNEQEFFGEGDNATFSFYTLHDAAHDDLALAVGALATPLRAPPTVAIHSMHPLGGPARGGTVVTLHGRGFAPLDALPNTLEAPRNREMHTLDDGVHDLHRSVIPRHGLFCLFDGVNVEVIGAVHRFAEPVRRPVITGTAHSPEVMTCVTPPYEELQRGDFGTTTAALNVSLEITLNGNPHEATGSGRQFTYYREERHMLPKLHGVQPFGGPSGGGTWLTIHGSLLQPLAGMGNTPLCRFGSDAENTTTPATITEGGHHASRRREQTVTCVAPPLPPNDIGERRDVALNVAMNGVDYARRALRFAYYPIDKLILRELSPSGGPADGGTSVLLSGRRIGSTRGGLHCQFGGTWVAATAETEDSVRCISPPRYNLTAGNVTSYPYVDAAVHVTVNDDVQPSAISPSTRPFTYYDPPGTLAISSIYPEAGGTDGGTSITLRGEGFRDLGYVRCKFGVAEPVLAEAPPPPPAPRPAPGVDGYLRLRNGGPSGLQGRVEIYHAGVWGTVCDDFWDLEDAMTVCRQLGLHDALNATRHGVFGPGSGPIWLDNVHCTPGTERLDRCGSHGWGVHDCDHHEDAGVVCAGGPIAGVPPAGPPPPGMPWDRDDDWQLTRHARGAHLGTEAIGDEVTWPLRHFNVSEFDEVICRAPSLREALGREDHRAVVKAVELRVTLDGQTYGEPVNYTYYPL